MLPILLIALLSGLVQLVLPWWSAALVAFVVCCWRSRSSGGAWMAGFLGVGLVWLVYGLAIHLRTDGIFTARMGELLFKRQGAVLPLLVTAVLGGLTGGLAGLSGYLVRAASANSRVSTPPNA
ncbi:hypothetical protein [Spirosoma luteolum]